MSWDIFGNPLARGHCEVHPHIPEPYPCSLCMYEKAQARWVKEMEEEYYKAMGDAQETEYLEAFEGSWPT